MTNAVNNKWHESQKEWSDIQVDEGHISFEYHENLAIDNVPYELHRLGIVNEYREYTMGGQVSKVFKGVILG